LQRGTPAGIVDHFAIGVDAFHRESLARELKSRGAEPFQSEAAGLHVKDPYGYTVQGIANPARSRKL
jgi:hypothetical protein